MNKNESVNIAWQTQAAIYGSGFFSFSMVLISNLVIAVMAYELTESEFLIGMIVGSRYFLTLALSIHGGVLMDRFGTRRVMIVVAAIATVAPVFFPIALALPQGPAITAIILLQMINHQLLIFIFGKCISCLTFRLEDIKNEICEKV